MRPADGPDKIERLACLYLAFLNNPHGLTFSAIRTSLPLAYQGEFESARRKFERDKEDLAAMGMPLLHYGDGEPLPNGGTADGHVYVPAEEARRLHELRLNPDEASALAFVLFNAIAGAEGDDSNDAEIYRSAAAKLLYKSSGAIPDETPEPARVRRDEPSGGELSVLALAHEGIRERRLLRFQYPSSDGTRRERDVEGRGLVMHRGRWGLAGYCRTAGGMRVFYTDRIAEPRLNEERYPPDPQFKIEQYSLHPLAVRKHAQVNVELEVLTDKEEVFQEFLAGLVGAKEKAGRFSFSTTNLDALFSWMMRNPGTITKLGPSPVRDEFQKRLEALTRTYEGR
ncbi:MAG: WYL domain-containing protein [Spirochaetia bacterium]|nr:WYL domain-containing protein [Spirochaetia bacterium]